MARTTYAALNVDDRTCLHCRADYTAHLEELRCPPDTLIAELQRQLDWRADVSKEYVAHIEYERDLLRKQVEGRG